MGNNLFGANISGQLKAAFAGKLLTAQLRRATPTTRDPVHPSQGTAPVHTVWTGLNGFCDAYATNMIGKQVASAAAGIDTTIRAGDTKVSILGDTIPAAAGDPQGNDEIFIEGRWRKVVGIDSRDPDRAMFTLHCRG